jgi:hypothetical protein
MAPGEIRQNNRVNIARVAGPGRAAAGAAVTVVAALLVYVAVHGSGGGHRAGTSSASSSAVAAALSAGASARPSGGQSAPAGSGMAVTASGSNAAADHGDPLGPAAVALTGDRAGTVLAAVYDIKTGQTWQLGDGPAQDEASVVKLNILETLLADSGAAGLPAGDQPLAAAMIEDSDNDAATSLWDAVGGGNGLAAYNAQAGLTSTTPSACVACAGFAWPGWGLSTTIPDDQLLLLKQLVVPGPHSLLSVADRRYALSLLENVRPDQAWGVSGGVPVGMRVALKNGWLPLDAANTDWQINSVGWVNGDGRDYLIAVLSTGNPSMQYGVDTINSLSALVWSAMR